MSAVNIQNGLFVFCDPEELGGCFEKREEKGEK